MALVGFVFLPKKLPRVLNHELRALAEAWGLELFALDPHEPIAGQEPGRPQLQQDQEQGHGQGNLKDEGQQQRPRSSQQPQRQGQGQEPAQMPEGPRTGVRFGACLPGTASAATCSSSPGFSVIVHKLHQDPVWEAHLAEYVRCHPHLQLLDPPAAIHATEDRALMLAAIPQDGLRVSVALGKDIGPGDVPTQLDQVDGSGQTGPAAPSAEPRAEQPHKAPQGRQAGGAAAAAVVATVMAPAQRVIRSREELRQLAQQAAGLQPPLIIKTQRADAAGGSGHGLAVATTWAELQERAEGLQRAAVEAAAGATGAAGPTVTATGTETASGAASGSPVVEGQAGCSGGDGDGGCGSGGSGGGWVPLVVQQYVPHSESLYKVYVLGSHVRVTRRASLTLDRLQALAAPHSGAGGSHHPHQAQGQQGEGPSEPPAKRQHSAGGDAALHHHHQHVLEKLSAQPHESSLSPVSAGETATAEAAGAERGDAVTAVEGDLMDRSLAAVAQRLSALTGLTMFNFDVVVPIATQQATSSAAATEPMEAGAGTSAAESGSTETTAAARRANHAPGSDGCGGGRADAHGRGLDAAEARSQPLQLQLYVVDINYFPGYDKLQGWEGWLVEHLRRAADRAAAAAAAGSGGDMK